MIEETNVFQIIENKVYDSLIIRFRSLLLLAPKDFKNICFPSFNFGHTWEVIKDALRVSNGVYACCAYIRPVLLPWTDRTKTSTHYWYVVQDTKGSRYWFTCLQLFNLVCYIVMSAYLNVFRVIVIIHYKAYLNRLCRCCWCSINILPCKIITFFNSYKLLSTQFWDLKKIKLILK